MRPARPVGVGNSDTNDLRKDGRRKGPQHQKQFATETAELTGAMAWSHNLADRHVLMPEIPALWENPIPINVGAKLRPRRIPTPWLECQPWGQRAQECVACPRATERKNPLG